MGLMDEQAGKTLLSTLSKVIYDWRTDSMFFPELRDEIEKKLAAITVAREEVHRLLAAPTAQEQQSAREQELSAELERTIAKLQKARARHHKATQRVWELQQTNQQLSMRLISHDASAYYCDLHDKAHNQAREHLARALNLLSGADQPE